MSDENINLILYRLDKLEKSNKTNTITVGLFILTAIISLSVILVSFGEMKGEFQAVKADVEQITKITVR